MENQPDEISYSRLCEEFSSNPSQDNLAKIIAYLKGQEGITENNLKDFLPKSVNNMMEQIPNLEGWIFTVFREEELGNN